MITTDGHMRVEEVMRKIGEPVRRSAITPAALRAQGLWRLVANCSPFRPLSAAAPRAFQDRGRARPNSKLTSPEIVC